MHLYLSNPLYIRTSQIAREYVAYKPSDIPGKLSLKTDCFGNVDLFLPRPRDGQQGSALLACGFNSGRGPFTPMVGPAVSRCFTERESLVLLPEIGPRFLAHSIPANSLIATPPRMNRPASRNVLFVGNDRRRMKSVFYVVATIVRTIQNLLTFIALNGNFSVEKQKGGIDRLGM